MDEEKYEDIEEDIELSDQEDNDDEEKTYDNIDHDDDDLLADDDDDRDEEDVETEDIEEEYEDITNTEFRLRRKNISFPILTTYERTNILGTRAQQIMHNSPILIDINTLPEDKRTPYYIALEELKNLKVPFKVKRKFPDNTYELWNIKDFKRIF